MNHSEILKKSWKILWSYKTLWVFGIILAMTSGGGGGGGNGANVQMPNEAEPSFDIPGFEELEPQMKEFQRMFENGISTEAWQTVAILILCLLCVFLLLGLAFTVLRYVSQVALIRMVDQHEASGTKVNWRAGFKLGWSRSALRLFLIDWVIAIPVIILFIGLFGCAALPVLLSIIANNEPSVGGIIATIGLVFMAIFLAILVGAALALVVEIIRRRCVLAETGVFASIGEGWRLVRKNLKDVFLMWLILIGVNIAFFIIMIPIFLLLLAFGLLVGGGAGLAVYLISQGVSESGSLISAILLGGMLFVLILSIPSLFISGLKETYVSSAWTLAYRSIANPKPNPNEANAEAESSLDSDFGELPPPA